MRHFIALAALLWIHLPCLAQQRTAPKFQLKGQGLQTGDEVPEVFFDRIWNYASPTAKLSDFKGNWLIIDLYATWCTNCLTELPRLQALKDQFGDKLQILVVTYEHDSLFQKLRNRNKLLRSIRLPFVTGDSLLHQLFPHRTIPHDVWIDPEGKVHAITAPDEVNQENIEAMLAGKKVNLRQKKDLLYYDHKNPLVTEDKEFLYRSILTKSKGTDSKTYIENSDDTVKKVKRILLMNKSVPDLYYWAAYKGRLSSIMNNKRIIFETKSPEKWIRPATFPTEKYATAGEWQEDNSYCYELILPLFTSGEDAYQYMLEDLNRLFSIRGNLERRKRDCWVIYNSDAGNKRFHSSSSRLKLTWAGGVLEKAEHIDFDALMDILNANRVNMDPIINETGYNGPVDMILGLAVYNTELSITALKKALKQYGLDIKKAERPIEVLVIKDK